MLQTTSALLCSMAMAGLIVFGGRRGSPNTVNLTGFTFLVYALAQLTTVGLVVALKSDYEKGESKGVGTDISGTKRPHANPIPRARKHFRNPAYGKRARNTYSARASNKRRTHFRKTHQQRGRSTLLATSRPKSQETCVELFATRVQCVPRK